ncbi:hypothetical protein GCM10027168_69220 [Streptomyces capparidis]
MSEHHEQHIAPPSRRGPVQEGLEHAERGTFTRPVPKTARAQARFLLGRAQASTKALAARPGISQRTVQRATAPGPSARPARPCARPSRTKPPRSGSRGCAPKR